MSILRPLGKFWITWVTTIVLACFSNAVAQTSYKVTDLGTLHNGYFGCAMGLNNHGWTETQYGVLNASGKLVNGRVAINVGGFTLDLGTLGGPNSWDNPFGGEINERGQIAGMATVLSGPHAGETHVFLATPVNQSIGRSMAEVARTQPKITMPANVGKQLLPRFGPGRSGR